MLDRQETICAKGGEWATTTRNLGQRYLTATTVERLEEGLSLPFPPSSSSPPEIKQVITRVDQGMCVYVGGRGKVIVSARFAKGKTPLTLPAEMS